MIFIVKVLFKKLNDYWKTIEKFSHNWKKFSTVIEKNFSYSWKIKISVTDETGPFFPVVTETISLCAPVLNREKSNGKSCKAFPY